MSTVRFITQKLTNRWPIVEDAKPKAVVAFVEAAANLLVETGSTLKADIVTVNENCYVTLIFILTRRQSREAVSSSAK